MPQANSQDTAMDDLGARLIQAQGILVAVSNSYDDGLGGYKVADEYLRSALWGAEELLTQARAAFDQMTDGRCAPKTETTMGAEAVL